jgi:hypothetical protein
MINFQAPKYCLITQNDRYQETAFLDRQNAEKEHNETLNKKVQN